MYSIKESCFCCILPFNKAVLGHCHSRTRMFVTGINMNLRSDLNCSTTFKHQMGVKSKLSNIHGLVFCFQGLKVSLY